MRKHDPRSRGKLATSTRFPILHGTNYETKQSRWIQFDIHMFLVVKVRARHFVGNIKRIGQNMADLFDVVPGIANVCSKAHERAICALVA